MPDFEKLFAIPADHELEQVRSRSRGGAITGIYWTHDQYDPSGRLVARFESFDERNSGTRRTGWRKYSSDGALLDECRPLWPDKAA